MQLQGLQEAKDRLQRALDSGAVQSAPGAARLFIAVHSELSTAYKSIQDTRVAGQAAKMRGWFREIDADTLSVLCLHEVLNTLSTGEPASVQLLMARIGRRIHLEALVQQAAKVNAMYVHRTEQYLAQQGTKSTSHYTSTMRAAVRNVLMDVEFLLNSEYAQLGKLGLNAIIDAGIIVRVPRESGMHMYDLSEPVQKALSLVPAMAAGKAAMSMLIPPNDWTTITQGGYLESPWHPLVKRSNFRRQDYHKVANSLKGSRTMQIVNSVQEQGWVINQPVRDMLVQLWREGGGTLGVPTRQYPEPPAYPLPDGWKENDKTDENELIHSGWLSSMHGWYSARSKHQGAIREMAALQRDSDLENPQWFPNFMDSRGRMYYRGRVNPQGSDRAKALLGFKQAKPLGERGLYWLKVGLANAFGYDKARFDARVAWVHEHMDLIREGVWEPQDSDFYRGNTEAPVMAVSIARELVEALDSDNPEGYLSRVPIHMDATCSGLQHLSAILRDPIGGLQVNLMDNGLAEKSDLYTAVADRALKLAVHDCNGEDAEYAEFWLRNGIPRDLAKRPVMTYCYGVTFQGVMRYVDAYLFDEDIRINEQQVPFRYRTYCTRLLLRAIEESVPKAAAFMQWLQQGLAGRALEHVQWETATGFPVIQYVAAMQRKRVNVRSCGINQVVLYDQLNRPDNMKMRNSIVPNLVHSNDATHWFMTAERMRQQGLAIVGVHDSFGTHAADVDQMHSCIRESFIELYRDYNLVQNYIEHNGIDLEAPSTGSLDIELFRHSEFGFC